MEASRTTRLQLGEIEAEPVPQDPDAARRFIGKRIGDVAEEWEILQALGLDA